jgi:hypothetical protein
MPKYYALLVVSTKLIDDLQDLAENNSVVDIATTLVANHNGWRKEISYVECTTPVILNSPRLLNKLFLEVLPANPSTFNITYESYYCKSFSKALFRFNLFPRQPITFIWTENHSIFNDIHSYASSFQITVSKHKKDMYKLFTPYEIGESAT